MLKLTSLVIILFSMNAFASTNGGGVLMKNFSMPTGSQFALGIGGGSVGPRPTSEIVFHMEQENGLVKFAYGQLHNNKWQVRTLEISEDALMLDSSAFSAIERSKMFEEWVEIQ